MNVPELKSVIVPKSKGFVLSERNKSEIEYIFKKPIKPEKAIYLLHVGRLTWENKTDNFVRG